MSFATSEVVRDTFFPKNSNFSFVGDTVRNNFPSSSSSSRYSTSNLLSNVAEELINSSDPNLTKETLVLRTLKKLTETVFNLPWSRVLDTIRQGQCYLDKESHLLLKEALMRNVSSTNATCGTISQQQQHDEAIERIAARDYVKKSDVDRLAAAIASFETNIYACRLFAVDGFSGFHDLKLYVHHFKCTEDYKLLHIRAVRRLYQSFCEDARHVFRVVERGLGTFQDDSSPSLDYTEAVDAYLEIVGSERVPAIRVWKLKEQKHAREHLEATIKKKVAAEVKKKISSVNSSSSLVVLSSEEDDASDDSKKKKRSVTKKLKRSEDEPPTKKLKKKTDEAAKKRKRKTEQDQSIKKQKEMPPNDKVITKIYSSEEEGELSSDDDDQDKAVLKTLIQTAAMVEERDSKENLLSF